MPWPLDPRPGRDRTAAALGGLAAFAGVELALRHGLALGPDAWTYWGASVALLDGAGYVDAHDLPVLSWPPLYPLWLAAVQAVAGVSIASVRLADALAIALAAAGFTLWALRRAREATAPRWPFATFVAAALVVETRGLASHYPMLALLAGFLLALDGVAAAATRRRRWLWLLGAAACGSGMALARHVGLLLTLAGAVLVVANRRTSRRERLALTVVLGAIPIAVWIGVRHALGQSGSHALFGSDRALFPTAWQMLHHIGRDLGPFPVGLLLLIAIVARLLALRRQRDALAFTATALFGVLAVFLLVPIADEPSSRFVGFAALIVGALGVGEAMRTSHRRLGLAALALLVLPPTVHAGKHVLFGRRGRESVTADGGERFLPPEAALVRRGREPPGRDRTTIVEPPLFRWDAERLRRGEGRR